MSGLAIALTVYLHFASVFACGALILSGKLDVKGMGLWPKQDFWLPPAFLALIPILNFVLIGFWVRKYYLKEVVQKNVFPSEHGEKTVCILVTDEMKPVPSQIRVALNFGFDSLVTEVGDSVRGEVCILKGTPSDFIEWLKPFDCVWTSLSPATGSWQACHVKDLHAA